MAGRLVTRLARKAGRRRSARALLRNPGFDPAWYRILSGDPAEAAADSARVAPVLVDPVLVDPVLVDHYLRTGRGQGFSPHPLFDPGYYVARGGPHRMLLESFAGYVRSTELRRRPTHPLLDVTTYLAGTPAAATYPGGVIEHCARVGDPALRERLVQHATAWARRRWYATATRLTSSFDQAAADRFVASYVGVVPEAGDAEVTVTVVLPVWNRAAQVGAAIESVRAQTLTDWELVVVDDGSTDDLSAVERAWAGDPRIRFLRRPHEGVGAARNAGLAVARGRYVAWLDSDDTWTPEHLRVTVAFMQREGYRAAYSVLELRRPGRPPGFRTLAGGREYLVNGNHIGQTVLVHERSLVDPAGGAGVVGGYDETLPRTVDFDFILRLSAVTDFGFAPFVGCIVNHDPADTSRITRSYPATWIDVVLNRDTLDWPVPRAADTAPASLAATVVCVAPVDLDLMRAAVDRLLRSTAESGAEILVVDNGLGLLPSQVLASLGWHEPRLRVVAAPSDRGWAVALNLGLLASRTDRVVLVDPEVELADGWLGALAAALDDPDVLGAQPGGVAQGLDTERAEVEALSWGACALRVSDLVLVHGLDPLIRPELAMRDLCKRLELVRPGRFVAVAASQVRLPAGGARPYSRHPELDQLQADLEGRAVFTERWPGASP